MCSVLLMDIVQFKKKIYAYKTQRYSSYAIQTRNYTSFQKKKNYQYIYSKDLSIWCACTPLQWCGRSDSKWIKAQWLETQHVSRLKLILRIAMISLCRICRDCQGTSIITSNTWASTPLFIFLVSLSGILRTAFDLQLVSERVFPVDRMTEKPP